MERKVRLTLNVELLRTKNMIIRTALSREIQQATLLDTGRGRKSGVSVKREGAPKGNNEPGNGLSFNYRTGCANPTLVGLLSWPTP